MPMEPPTKKARSEASLTLGAIATRTNGGELREHLIAAGMMEDVASEKQAMFAAAATRLVDEGLPADAGANAFWVPGRVEIAGNHTDYAGGRSLLAATTCGFTVVSVDREDSLCRIFTTFGLNREERSSASLDIHKDLEPVQGHWTAYPATVIRRLARNFDLKYGADIALECDLPESSGMSTSSAVICYMWMILARRNQLQATDTFKRNLSSNEDLCSYLGCIENGQNCGSVLLGDKGVGTFGGSEDHTAIMSCGPSQIKMFSYCPTKHEGTFQFPSELTFVIAVSGALAEKTGNAMADYNNAAFLARDAAAAWQKASGIVPLGGELFVKDRPNLAEIIRHVRKQLGDKGKCDASVRMAVGDMIAKVDDGKAFGALVGGSLRAYPCGALRERFEHFFDESEVMVPAIADAIAHSDLEALAKWSDESHRQKIECLRNTVPETAWLPQEARRLGALGASAFGAGFGGSCWAIVLRDGADAFAAAWAATYHARFPACAELSRFFTMSPGPGAICI